jgi:hypothetical protein
VQGKRAFPERIVGSEHIWLGAIGPAIKGKGLIKIKNVKQAQIAATVLAALGQQPHIINPNMAPAIKEILNENVIKPYFIFNACVGC